MFTLLVEKKPVCVGQYDLISRRARGIGPKALCRRATLDEIRSLPGVHAFMESRGVAPFRLVNPPADPAQGLLSPVQRNAFWGGVAGYRAEGVGAGMGYVPDGPEKTRGTHRNFARMARTSKNFSHQDVDGLHIATEYTPYSVTTYLYGPEALVKAEAERLRDAYPPAGYGTLIRNCDTYSPDSWYALVTRSRSCD
jgi:hypothetical protein